MRKFYLIILWSIEQFNMRLCMATKSYHGHQII